MSLLRELLAEPRIADVDLPSWLAGVEARHADRTPIERAVLAGAAASSMGPMFAAAYRAALVALTGRPAAALCVTEANGNHPRSLETRAAEGRLVGAKRWATMAGAAETLLVAAVEGQAEDRPMIGVYAVPANAEGVRLNALPPTPFVPEVPHFEVHLDVALADIERLPGDGWADLVKPFRTVEDLFVISAFSALALRLDEPGYWAGLLTGLVPLAAEDPKAPATHLALDGLLKLAHARLPYLADRDPSLARDLPLLQIARRARATRLERARQALGL